MSNNAAPIIEDIGEGYGEEGVISLWYGQGGSGKTHALGTIGDRGLIISCGEGQMTLRDPDHIKKYPKRPRITYIREEIDPISGMFRKAEAWNRFTDTVSWFLDQDNFDTLGVDDASILGGYARNLGMQTNQELGIGAPMIKSNQVGFPVPEIADFGKEVGIWIWFFTSFFPQFKARKKNFILLAHERHIYIKGPKVSDPAVLKFIRPGFTGNVLPDAIQNYFDFVWHFESYNNGQKFRAKTRDGSYDTATFQGKTRWGSVIPPEINDVDFMKVLDCLRNNKKYI